MENGSSKSRGFVQLEKKPCCHKWIHFYLYFSTLIKDRIKHVFIAQHELSFHGSHCIRSNSSRFLMAFCNWSFTWPLIILIFPEGKSHIVNRELPWRKTSLDGPPQMWFARTFYCHTRQSNTSAWLGMVTSIVFFCLPSDGCLFLIEKNSCI